MKIKNFKRFIRSILIILVTTIVLVLLIGNYTFSHKEIEYKRIYISEGDTLWNIAKLNQTSNDYYKGKDIRYIINDLIEINNLKTSNMQINQELLIPQI